MTCDVLCLRETWLLENEDCNQVTLAAMLPPGFKIMHMPRKNGCKGGGVGVIYNETIPMKTSNQIQFKKYNQFEVMCSSIYLKSGKLSILVVYRPPPNKKNGLKLKLFWIQWHQLLTNLVARSHEFIIVGDLNFHLDESSNRSTIKFNNILSEYGLIQHIKEATHVGGHILDVVITRLSSGIIRSLSIKELGFVNDHGREIKDHLSVSWATKAIKQSIPPKSFQFRNWKNVNTKSFQNDLGERMKDAPSEDSNAMVSWYNKTLAELSDIHAPVLTKQTSRKYNPWYNSSTRDLKRTRRKLERKWKKSQLTIDYQLLKQHSNSMYRQIRRDKINYNKTKISECGHDYKKAYSMINHMTGNNKESSLPDAHSDLQLANQFSDFFALKVHNIQQELRSETESQQLPSVYDDTFDHSQRLSEFATTTEDELLEILNGMPNKHCLLDPVPTWFLKKIISVTLPFINNLIFSSLSSATMPYLLKTAHVRPILKNRNLDRNDLQSYRPVSNLPFLGKVLEKVVSKRVQQFVDDNNLLDINQSAYRKYHSTETTMLKIHNDILNHLDQGCCVVLVSLDISAAFDTVNHSQLVKCFEQNFGICGDALQWLISYLSDRQQQVIINGTTSNLKHLNCGFPQGAVLAGIFYNMFTASLGKVVSKHEASHKGYADDNNWYMAFITSNIESKLQSLSICLDESKAWLLRNNLKLNNDKTQIICFTPQKDLNPIESLTLNSKVIKPVSVFKNLGVLLDSLMTMEKHLNSITQSAYLHIRNIAKIRQYLPLESAKTLTQALVISRIDYCNSLLGNIPLRLSNKLQRVQNAAAKMLFKKSRRSHVTPILKTLHWLPVVFRIKFKILLITYKSLNGLAPSYLKHLVHRYVPSRCLRSNIPLQDTLVTPRYRRRKHGGRTFSAISPILWNELPLNIRRANTVATFKSLLKTHYFNQYFIT